MTISRTIEAKIGDVAPSCEMKLRYSMAMRLPSLSPSLKPVQLRGDQKHCLFVLVLFSMKLSSWGFIVLLNLLSFVIDLDCFHLY